MTHPALVLGVSIDGYAVEGGYDVEGGPDSSFGYAQSLGRVRPSLRTAGTYEHLDELVSRAAALEVAELRLTMEWARLERRPDERDEAAMRHYERALQSAAAASLRVVVVLCDTMWPSWMGHEPWLSSWAPARFADHARWVAGRIEGLADTVVTFRAPNAAAREGWLTARRPPFRRGADDDAVSALDGMLSAHQLAVAAIAEVAPSLRRAILFEAGAAYAYEGAWRDAAAGIVDPVVLAARRDRFEREVAGRARSAPRRATAWPIAPRATRSLPRWSATPPFEWWLAGEDPAILAATLAHADGSVRTVELGAGTTGWEAQLASGLDAVRVGAGGAGGATTVHLHGLVSSCGPLDRPVGLLSVDQHGGGWSVSGPDDALVRMLGSSR